MLIGLDPQVAIRKKNCSAFCGKSKTTGFTTTFVKITLEIGIGKFKLTHIVLVINNPLLKGKDNHEKIFIPVGTAITKVAAVKSYVTILTVEGGIP